MRWERVQGILLAAGFCLAPAVGFCADEGAKTDSTIKADPKREVVAVRRQGEFKLDGLLDEKFWQEAPAADGFKQTWPKEGQQASESTLVKLAYDDEALYVGITCYDSKPDQIRRRLTRRDRSSEADFVQIAIDSYNDKQTAYAFNVNTSGVQRDLYIYNNNWTDDTWDAVWESKVKDLPQGWTVEMKIPYHCLRFPPKDEQEWGIDFIRYISRNDETARWQFVPRAEAAGVSRYGTLRGIAQIDPPRHLEVLPYTTSKIKTEPVKLGNPDGKEALQDIGADFKWAISNNTVLDATINPDFGQVEADGTVLNLGRTETFFPEKRPFFLEGLQLYDTPFNLFYSRRIGGPTRSPEGAASEDMVVKQPESSTILYAGKLSGKTHGGLSYSMVNAITTDEHAEYLGTNDDGDTVTFRERVAERSAANIARVKQDFLGNSSVGLTVTSLLKDERGPSYAGAIDWSLKTKKNNYGTRGQLGATDPGWMAPGWGAWLLAEKLSGKHVLGEMGFEYNDRAFDYNDLGFIGRADYVGGWNWMQYRTEKGLGPISRTWNNFNAWYNWTNAGDRLNLGGNWNGQVQFKNLWYLGGGHERTASKRDDREIGGGVLVPIPATTATWVWAETDYRKPVSGNINYFWGSDRDGAQNDYDLFMTVRPSTNMELTFGPSYGLSWNSSRYITTVDPSQSTPGGHLFAEQGAEQFSMTVRGIATFTTNLSVQLYAQPFVAHISHDNYKYWNGDDSYTPAPDQSLDGTPDDPDFSVLSFNANVVVRWEYRPGSTVYLVWTQVRDDFREIPSFGLKKGYDELFDLGSRNVFMVKLNYWWNI